MKTKRRIVSLLLVMLLSVSLFFTGCKTTKQTSGEGKSPKDSIVIANTEFSMQPEPPKDIGVPGFTYVHESLITLNDKLEPTPGLIKEWKRVDPLTWEFKLRDDVKFHNGKKFNAESVKFAFTRYFDMEKKGYTGKRVEAAVNEKSFDIIDNYTIKIKTIEPYPFLPILMTHTSIVAIEPGAYKNGEIVGTGPFTVKENAPDQYIVLQRNDKYWGNKPNMKEIKFKSIADSNARVMALQSGEANVAVTPSYSAVADLKKNYKVIKTPRGCTMKVIFNHKRDATSDVNVRKAISSAIDRQAIVDSIYSGIGIPANTLLPPDVLYSGEKEVKGFKHDPKLAKSLLKESGYKDTNNDGIVDKDGKNLKLQFPFFADEEGYKEAAEAIAQNLKDAGIDVEILPMDSTTYFTEVYENGKFDICLDLSGIFFGSSSTELFDDLYSKSGIGDACYFKADDKIDKLMEEGMELEALKKYDEANEKYVELQKRAYDELLVVCPIMHHDFVIVTDKDINNIKPLPLYDLFQNCNNNGEVITIDRK